MKLRSISLTNVRRFAGSTVRLDGLGDGLNLATATPTRHATWRG
jgi:hypothetical protein